MQNWVGKAGTLASFRLKNDPKISMVSTGMLRALRQLLHRPAFRLGLARDSRSRLRDPRFVSFIASSNRKTLNTDLQDAVLRGRRLAKQGLVLALAFGAVWFLLESAKALSVF